MPFNSVLSNYGLRGSSYARNRVNSDLSLHDSEGYRLVHVHRAESRLNAAAVVLNDVHTLTHGPGYLLAVETVGRMSQHDTKLSAGRWLNQFSPLGNSSDLKMPRPNSAPLTR